MLKNEILRIENLRVAYWSGGCELEAVRGVDLIVEAGTIVGLAGESGCGKSSVAKGLLRLLPEACRISANAMRFGTVDLLSASDNEYRALRGRHIALVSQNAATAFNPLRTVGSQLREILRRNGVERRNVDTTLSNALKSVGFSDPERVLRHRPHQCSGGMLQRFLLGAVIAFRPKLIIADEPTSALDATLQTRTLQLLRNLSIREGTAILFITHDLNAAATLCDRLIIMYGGLVVETGRTAEVLQASLHPYTRALLRASVLFSEAGSSELTPIVGMPPSLLNMPTGCPFEPRCPLREEECAHTIPALRTLSKGRRCRCHRMEEQEDA